MLLSSTCTIAYVWPHFCWAGTWRHTMLLPALPMLAGKSFRLCTSLVGLFRGVNGKAHGKGTSSKQHWSPTRRDQENDPHENRFCCVETICTFPIDRHTRKINADRVHEHSATFSKTKTTSTTIASLLKTVGFFNDKNTLSPDSRTWHYRTCVNPTVSYSSGNPESNICSAHESLLNV